MSSVLNIAISGLDNAIARSANAVSNIVNASSTTHLPKNVNDTYTGFVPQDVVSLSTSLAGNNLGVQTTTQGLSPAYIAVYAPNSSQANAQGLVATPNVDLTAELVTNSIAKVDYAANVAVIKIAQKNEKALLDIKT